MTRQEIAALICRTLALICTLAGFGALLLSGSLVLLTLRHGMTGYDRGETTFLGVICTTAIMSLFGSASLLWIFAEDIAVRMVSGSPDVVTKSEFSTFDGIAVALALVGGFLFINGCRDLIAYVVFIAWSEQPLDTTFRLGPLWGTVAQIILSLGLILGWRGIIRMIHWARTAGTPLAEDPSSPD